MNQANRPYLGKGESRSTRTGSRAFCIFNGGMNGIYLHCGSQHLQRYLREFDFRYTYRSANGIEDDQRAEIALKGIAGKRLTYRRIGAVAA